mgnify:CR=1 FL=1
MRTALKNKQNLKYSLIGDAQPIYAVKNGELVFTEVKGQRVPAKAGYTEPIYGEAVPFIGYITPIGSESYARGNVAYARAYGIDISAYDALILMKNGEIPVTETSVIWHKSQPKHKVIKNVLLLDSDGEAIEDSDSCEAIFAADMTVIDENSADYIVKRVASSMNITLILLRRLNQDGNG